MPERVDALNPLITQLRESQDFQAIMEDLMTTRPLIPGYTPQKTRDETENLIEQIKHKSSMQQGWDLLYQQLIGRKP